MGIDHLAQGKSFLSTKIECFLRSPRKRQHNILLKQNLSTHLTTTELKTMCRISLGSTTQEIAEEWNRSHHTINNHWKILLRNYHLPI